jgi:uncharacterized membrane protein
MINGLLLGAAAAFFWSLTNIIDKYLTKRHAGDGNVWGILILSCFFPAILLPISLFFAESIRTDVLSVSILLGSGTLMVAWIYFYLKALTEEDTSVVMTLLVLAPFFSLVWSSLLLGETLTTIQLTGGAIIVLGSLIVSYTKSSNSFNIKLIYYAVSASVVMGLMHTLFKYSTETDIFWQSLFWRSTGMVITGILLCLLFSAIWIKFYNFVKHYLKDGLTINSTNESLTLVGDTLFGFAVLLAPLALIQTTEAYQPIFIILISFILTQFGVTAVTENYTRDALIQKGAGIAFVIAGSFILVFNN